LHTLKYRLSRLFYTWRQQGKEKEREKSKKYGANAPQLRHIWPQAAWGAHSPAQHGYTDTSDTIDTTDTIDTNLIGKTLPNGDTP
jgi:hypothetical protein